MTPLAYLNGRLVPFADAALPLHDAGFVSGATVVDNARTFNRRLFRWPAHLARLRRDCDACFVPLPYSDADLTAAADELVALNARLLPAGGELQLVTFATPGPLGFYLGDAASGPPTLGMVTYPLPVGRYRRFFTDGVTLAVAGVQHAAPGDLLPPRVKHRSRLFWHVADRAVNTPGNPAFRPGAVPVVLNQHGVGDTAIGSILVVADGVVVRPVPGSVQDGISLGVVAELCAALGLRCEEREFDLRTLDGLGADRVSEVLLAGTGFCVAGVRAVADRAFGWPGPVYRRLLAAWSDTVGVDVERQFTGVV